MTEASNNQGGEFGVGWGLSGAGFVERTYSTCVNASKCWRSVEELSLSLNGHSSQLVPTGSNDEWRLKSDPGWRVRRFKTAPDSATMPNDTNGGPNTGEYWVVTTPDGTQYFFGYGREGATQFETNARWTVPVYQVPGCSGWCYKPWRWNLDRIIDTNGNVMSMVWDPEFNLYGAGGAPYAPVRYVRGGVLAVVAYGKRAGYEATPPPTRIVVHTQPRCVQLTSCPALTVANASSYPDVPVDQICTAAPCYSYSPTFFTSRRVDYIETYAPDPAAGGAQHVVSRYMIGNSFVQNPLQGDQRLWLGSIQRVGLPDSSPLWAPAVQFASYWANLDNRADSLTMYMFRLDVINNGLGGSTYVNYGQTHPCNLSTLATHWSQWYTPAYYRSCFVVPGDAAFNKYVVMTVTERDWVGSSVPNGPLSPDVVTNYTYLGEPGWQRADDQTAGSYWNDWRGYGVVRVSVGSGTTRTITEHRQFRGVSGNGNPARSLQTSSGVVYDDVEQLAGLTLEEAVINQAQTALLSRTVHEYGYTPVTATNSALSPVVSARFVGETKVSTVTGQLIGARTAVTETTWNTSLPISDPRLYFPDKSIEKGDLATSADDRCTVTQWTVNLTDWIVASNARLLQAGACTGAWASYSQTFYDGHAGVTDPPSKGNATKVVEFADANTGLATNMQYDAAGRQTWVQDARGNISTSQYDATTGAFTSTTDALGYQTLFVQDPGWGVTTRLTDPNGRITTMGYDALGRNSAYYPPGLTVGGPAAVSVEYQNAVQNPSGTWTSPAQSRVWTFQDLHQGQSWFTSSITMVDGLGRVRETHVPSPAGGRVVSATFYNDRGLPERVTMPFYSSAPNLPWGSPSVLTTSAVYTATSYGTSTYDEAGRATAAKTYVNNTYQFQSTAVYDGWWTTSNPPVGSGTRIENNGLGQVERSVAFGADGTNPASWSVTTFGYNVRGDLTSRADPGGNTTSYGYDWLGRQISANDPDAGTRAYEYDAVSNLVKSTDAKGQVLLYGYDQLNRPTTTHHTAVQIGNEVSYRQYDSGTNPDGSTRRGLLVSSTSWTPRGVYSESILAYDSRNRPTTTRYTLPASDGLAAGNWDFSSTFNSAGAVTSTTYPAIPGSTASETLSTDYTPLGTPLALASSSSGPLVLTTDYNSLGQLRRRKLNNTGTQIWRDFYYDDFQRLSGIQTLSPVGDPANPTGYSWMQAAGYTYDANNNLTRTDDAITSEKECFQYDLRNRLVQAFTSAASACSAFSGAFPNPYWQVWSHNQIGNITNFRDLGGDHFYSYNPSGTGAVRPHAPTAAYNQTGLTYDANGSRTAYTATTGTGAGTYALSWDRQNRLATVTKSGGTNTGTSRFTYNATGQRLVREDPDGTLTWYLGPLELRRPPGASTLSWTRYYAIAGTTIAYRIGNGAAQPTLTWLAGNNQGSETIAISNGTLTSAQTRYHPYGTIRGTDQLTTTERGFLGQTEDTRTNLTYLNNRYQDPTTGTFISVDPLVGKTGTPYLYANGNPTTLSDPS
ncbi:MAG: RHS repeat-associated core domain-containing protein, partial [Ilumatobacteraceae bacterium]